MIRIKGIQITNSPFEIRDYIGVLLYQEFPVTTIYSNNDFSPVIKEWVDCEDGIDRFLMYQSSSEQLKLFITEVISHRELIVSAIDGLVLLVDEGKGVEPILKVISSSNIPIDYLPANDVYFSYKNGVETQNVIEYFDLNQVEVKPINLNNHLKILAEEQRSDVFNIHLKEGIGVRHGKVDTDVLGATLVNFDNLYKEVSLDHYFGKNRGEQKLSKKLRKEKLGLSATEVFLNKAASYVVFVKPKYSAQLDMYENIPSSQMISQNFFRLIEISKDENTLQENYLKFSDFVFKSYTSFLKNITEFEIKIGLGWTNSTSEIMYEENFNIYEANRIIELIRNISSEDKEEFKVKGKFRAINCNTGYFTFVNLKDEQYSGYFDKLIIGSTPLLTFTNLYEVSIERRTVKEAGSPDPRIKNTIVAHYEIKD